MSRQPPNSPAPAKLDALACLRYLLVLACLVQAPFARAAELRHRVGEDESLERIAKNYYGASWKSVYLRARNGIEKDEAMVGRQIVVPSSWVYRVKRGDSLAAVAKKMLGGAHRYKAIVAFNNLRDPTDLEVGRELLMPFHLIHRVTPGQTLAQIAQRYYRDARRAPILRDYNQLDRLLAGQKLTVPIFDEKTVDARSRHYDATAEHGGGPPPGSSEQLGDTEARKQLEAGIFGLEAGEFDEACLQLETLLQLNVLDDANLVQLFKHLGFCAVAHDDTAAAKDYFRKWLELEPKARLDPVRTSPKILTPFYEVANDLNADEQQQQR